MATKSWAERFEEVQDAISAIVTTGQSVSYRGRQLSMANLKELRELSDYYESKMKQEAGTAVRSRVSYITPVV